VLVSGKPTEHGLPQQTDQRMAAVLASARIGEHLTRQRGQPERIVKFAIGEQPGIGRDHGATKLEHQAAIKIEPDGIRFRFARWVCYRRLPASRISRGALYLNRGPRWRNQSVIRGMQVQYNFAQNIGMPLAGLSKLDNLLGNNAVGEIVCKPERYASHFERDSQNPLGFGIGIELV